MPREKIDPTKKLSPEEKLMATLRPIAQKFWEKNKDRQGMREMIIGSILSETYNKPKHPSLVAAIDGRGLREKIKNGTVPEQPTSRDLDENDQASLAARKLLAMEMGYKVGVYEIMPRVDTAVATLKKIGPNPILLKHIYEKSQGRHRDKKFESTFSITPGELADIESGEISYLLETAAKLIADLRRQTPHDNDALLWEKKIREATKKLKIQQVGNRNFNDLLMPEFGEEIKNIYRFVKEITASKARS